MAQTLNHPKSHYWLTELGNPRLFLLVLLLRCMIFGAAVICLDYLFDLGSLSLALPLAACIGVIFGSWTVFRFPMLVWLALAALIALLFFSSISDLLFSFSSIFVGEASDRGHALSIIGFSYRASLVLCVFLLSFLLSAGFWKHKFLAVLESALAVLLIVWFFAPHRLYKFSEAPQVLSEISWWLGVSQLSTLVLIGSVGSAVLLLYLLLSNHPSLPHPGGSDTHTVHRGGQRAHLYQVTGFLLVMALVVGVGRLIYLHHQSQLISQGSNGVSLFNAGSEAIGKSPLGFHSALGSNNQPAALVRLEGDYTSNPHQNMLYLREGTLSKLGKNEMVRADPKFDEDAPLTSPGASFERKPDEELEYRVPILHSVYLMANHDSAFAIDYPIRIVQLENPAPSRFSVAYRAYSLAPAYQLDSLVLSASGDPDWSEEDLQHFLEAPEDPRYLELAEQITQGLLTPFEKARNLAEHLSQQSIYTLSPGHQVGVDQDPVVPYLFGDRRGYCVHFAHAMVYLMRSLGIPSRIATGYLTDLSYARDGHILLRMSDRHAWAEAYFKGIGWVVFDVQPENVESHADSAVDLGLLEELMGLVGPDQEILAQTKIDGLLPEPSKEWENPFSVKGIAYFLLSLLALLVVLKLLLLYGWKLLPDGKLKTKWLYISTLSRLWDLGYPRQYGETRVAYSQRIKNLTGVDTTLLTEEVIHYKYLSQQSSARMTATADFSVIPPLKKVLQTFNPLSLFEAVLRRSW